MSGAELELRLLSSLDGVADRWDALADRQRLPSPFLRSWWVDHTASGVPVILCWYAGDELVGGAALEQDRPGRGRLSIERIRCVGQGVLAPDHLDLLADDEHRDVVCEQLLGWLRRPGSRLVDLDGLAAQGTLANALAPHVIERTGAPFATLPADPERYLADRPGKLRSTITRTAKRLTRDGAEHRRVPPADAERALEDLARLHEGRWADESEFLSAWPRFRAAAMTGMHSGDVTIDEIVSPDGQVVATELDLLTPGRTSFYQAGRSTDRDWRGGGSMLRAEIVRRAIAEGRVEYDLLRGDEPYKADWSGERRELVRCRFGVGPLGIAAMRAIRLRPRLQSLSHAAWRRVRSPRTEPNG